MKRSTTRWYVQRRSQANDPRTCNVLASLVCDDQYHDAETNVHKIPTLDFLTGLGVPTIGLNALIYAGNGLTVGTGLEERELQPLLDIAVQKTSTHDQRLIWYTPTQYCQFTQFNKT